MNCHMHQPNMFLNTYLGYTMWDYESDAPFMWPEKQNYPTAEEVRKVLDRNPEGAAPRGNWADLDFLRNVFDLNPKLKDTQFADYHGHGWNFRAVFKRDRDGNLLDANGKIVRHDDPEKWRKTGEGKFVPAGRQSRQGGPHDGHPRREGHAVRRLPLRPGQPRQRPDHGRGRQCGRDRLPDCHGTVGAYPTLRTSGPAAPPERHRPDAAAQSRRPAPLRMGGAATAAAC